MAYTAVARGPETDAILAALSAVLLTGDAQRPAAGGWATDGDPTSVFTPYLVVYPSIIATIDGPVGDPFADLTSEYLVRGVGATRAQAQWALDKARGVFLNGGITVPGRTVQMVRFTAAQIVARDDDVPPAVYTGSDLYEIDTTT